MTMPSINIGYLQKRGCLILALTVLLTTVSTSNAAAPITPQFPQSLSLSQSQDGSEALANQLWNQATEQYQAGQIEAAIQSWQEALKIYREISHRQGEAEALNRLGEAYRILGKLPQAMEYHQQHLELARKLDDLSGEGSALGNLGLIYYDLGEYATAIKFYQQSLEISNKIGDSQTEANALANLGITHRILGNYIKAIDYLKKALAMTEKLDNPENTGMILGFLANAYGSIGYYDNALEYQRQSLLIAQKTDNRRGEGFVLANLGTTYAKLGKYTNAIGYHLRSLDIAQEISDRKLEGSALASLGSDYHAIGNFDKAIKYYQKSWEILQKTDNSLLKGETLSSLGLAYDSLGNYKQSIEYHEQGLAIFQSINALPEKAMTLNNLAHTLLKAGKLAEADKNLEIAVDILDSLRTNLDDATHISIFDTQAFTYNLRQQVLVAQEQSEAALAMSERGRTRAFTALLSQKLSANAESLSITPTVEEIKQIAKKQNATLVEYSIIPEDNFLHQGKLRGSGAELYIWVVKPTGEISLHQVDLKSQNIDIENLIQSARCQNIGVRGRSSTDSQCSKESGTTQPEQEQKEEKEQKQQLKKLYQILIEPIADLLPTNPEDRVIFIPDRQLFLVPFPALLDANNNYLIEKHTILTSPSIQSLSFTHQNRNRIKNEGLTGEVLIVGNPTMPKRQVGEKLESLTPLSGAESEAEEIAKQLNNVEKFNRKPIQPLIQDEATEAVIVKRMANAQIIHLATHGLLDDINGVGAPGAIALAPSGNDDGFLTTDEIMNLYGLPGKPQLRAELVVLSACDTGRGDITGDGVIGLSRSLIAAGVPSVIVSLWKVPDNETSELMTKFYENLYQNRLDKAQALRQAMLTMVNIDPKKWAAFTLIGEVE